MFVISLGHFLTTVFGDLNKSIPYESQQVVSD